MAANFVRNVSVRRTAGYHKSKLFFYIHHWQNDPRGTRVRKTKHFHHNHTTPSKSNCSRAPSATATFRKSGSSVASSSWMEFRAKVSRSFNNVEISFFFVDRYQSHIPTGKRRRPRTLSFPSILWIISPSAGVHAALEPFASPPALPGPADAAPLFVAFAIACRLLLSGMRSASEPVPAPTPAPTPAPPPTALVGSPPNSGSATGGPAALAMPQPEALGVKRYETPGCGLSAPSGPIITGFPRSDADEVGRPPVPLTSAAEGPIILKILLYNSERTSRRERSVS